METISLFTPGPTHTPLRIKQAISTASDHHRTDWFRKLFLDTAKKLRAALNAPTNPLFLSSSGTGAMEAVLGSGLQRDSVLGYLDCGKFGERWGCIAKRKGISTIPLKLPWGESPSVEDLKTYLSANTDITHFALQYCETSTAILHDVPNLLNFIHSNYPHIHLFVDAISAATTLRIDLSTLPIDALILASQKAFMVPPGLSMVFLSDRYWETRGDNPPESLYFDLFHERKTQAVGNASWTPPIGLIAGLSEALDIFREEGWENVYQRHLACSTYCMDQCKEIGFSPISQTHTSPSLSGAYLPKEINASELTQKLHQSKNIRIAGGQGEWKGKIIRIGHMGVITPEDLKRCFQAIKETLTLLKS